MFNSLPTIAWHQIVEFMISNKKVMISINSYVVNQPLNIFHSEDNFWIIYFYLFIIETVTTKTKRKNGEKLKSQNMCTQPKNIYYHITLKITLTYASPEFRDLPQVNFQPNCWSNHKRVSWATPWGISINYNIK